MITVFIQSAANKKNIASILLIRPSSTPTEPAAVELTLHLFPMIEMKINHLLIIGSLQLLSKNQPNLSLREI
jgi:hypothetical protein